MGHFRPISLCTAVYKVVSKVIVNRIRPFMQQLISPLQTAFIHGRKGLDNMIITQEILHSMERKKGRTGVMALKIDLEKAFDRLEWSFVREVLVHFNFPPNLITLIMDCISSSTVSILFNGGKLDPFTPSHRIRQGDPISPYIFILCLEYLGLLIHDKITFKAWKAVKASRTGPAFSHLFFCWWPYFVWSSYSFNGPCHWWCSQPFLPRVGAESKQWEVSNSFLQKHPWLD